MIFKRSLFMYLLLKNCGIILKKYGQYNDVILSKLKRVIYNLKKGDMPLATYYTKQHNLKKKFYKDWKDISLLIL